MKSYLAERYMSGPKADVILAKTNPKKKKRKHASTSASVGGGVGIVDEDLGWGDAPQQELEDDHSDVIVASDRSFKKRKTGNDGWVSVAGPSQPQPSPPPEEDEKPLIVETTQEPAPRGGLLSAEEVKRQFESQRKKLQIEEPTEEQQETIYRDASGRKIDTKAEKAAAARRKRELEEMEAKRMEWGKGLSQRDAKEQERREAEIERHKGFSRTVDDQQLNESQRDEMRWNDPAAAFLTKKRTKGPKKPQYTGPPPPPNRFGILPGYRWDGVDRSNGFEKKMFQRGNERSRRGLEAYQWSVDEM